MEHDRPLTIFCKKWRDTEPEKFLVLPFLLSWIEDTFLIYSLRFLNLFTDRVLFMEYTTVFIVTNPNNHHHDNKTLKRILLEGKKGRQERTI